MEIKKEFELMTRSLEIPGNKIGWLKRDWIKIYTAVVEYGQLELRFNNFEKKVELRTCKETKNVAYLERSIVFIQAVIDGFRVEDAVSIMKFPDIFTEFFHIGDIRKLKGSHLSRAVGRIIGRGGIMKKRIEQFSRTKFILESNKIMILGTEESIKIAKDAIGRLVQGSEPTSIFNRLRVISGKLKEKYGSLETVYEDLQIQ